ncbi:germination protein YpeB [Pradoshia eiseniae]|uniref:Germination protein YpeB n=1 Tax=Pradoshia eiseniae TaxID=2064768 RepID=A0A2S7N4D4_9BACI|nr:germination protein YpeB [Pradoshia eiseniae]PQD96894.1 germination protein YpeB [Pradoshia eiseniae]
MIRNILIGVLAIGLAGTAYWGYTQKQEKDALLINAENTYQRAFNDLAYDMDVLNDKIGTTLAMNSRESLSPALVDVWRITNSAHGSVGQLPLTLMPFHETEAFLTKIGDFAYQTSVRDLDKSPLTDQEYKTLEGLYKNSSEIQGELRKVQSEIMSNNLKWTDVEMVLAQAEGDEPQDNLVIDGLKTIEKNAKSYGQKDDYGTAFTSSPKKITYDHINDKVISRKEAIKHAKEYANVTNAKSVKVTENKDGSNYDFYHVSMNVRDGENVDVDLTKKGGYPIYIINDRAVGKAKISLNDGFKKAESYLKKMGYKNIGLYESTQYQNVGVYTFVTELNTVPVYEEAIKIKVGLDDGTIVGLVAEDYLQNHKDRTIGKPKISEEEARKSINPKVKIMDQKLSMLTNDLYEDVLCYEFMGTIGNDTYRIYINAENGKEEKVEKMHEAAKVYNKVS